MNSYENISQLKIRGIENIDRYRKEFNIEKVAHKYLEYYKFSV